MMAKIFKGINLVLTLILIFIAIGIAYIAIPIFGNQALIVRSGSMTPTIDVGSIVVTRGIAENLISPVSGSTPLYKTGDIIAFRSEKNSQTIVTHRIVDIEAGIDGVYYQTKGDANDSKDGWQVNQQNILGKVYFILPYLGLLLAFAKSDLGFPLLIIFPALAVIFLELITIIKEIQKKRKENFEIHYIRLTKQSFFDRFRIGPSTLLRTRRFNLYGLKVLIPILAFSLVVPFAIAFLNDTETSTGNVFTAAASFPQTSSLFVSNGFTCSGGASDITTSKGTVTISKNGDLDVLVTLTGALPNTSYDLWVNQDPGACPLGAPTVPLFITTNGSGDGTNSLNNHGLVGGATNFWVSLVGGTDVLRSTAVSF